MRDMMKNEKENESRVDAVTGKGLRTWACTAQGVLKQGQIDGHIWSQPTAKHCVLVDMLLPLDADDANVLGHQ